MSFSTPTVQVSPDNTSIKGSYHELQKLNASLADLTFAINGLKRSSNFYSKVLLVLTAVLVAEAALPFLSSLGR